MTQPSARLHAVQPSIVPLVTHSGPWSFTRQTEPRPDGRVRVRLVVKHQGQRQGVILQLPGGWRYSARPEFRFETAAECRHWVAQCAEPGAKPPTKPPTK